MADFIFGPYALSTDASTLTRDGAAVRLRPRAFHALRVLLSHVGSVVDYDTIIAEGWEGVHVSRHTVDVTLAEVRRRLGEYGRWIEHRGKYGYALQVPKSDELVRQGWHFWGQRTRAGCERAIDCFARVTADCSSNFRAFEGLSASYLALAVFGMRCPVTMYPLFLEAHKRAVALSGLRPELRCDRAKRKPSSCARWPRGRRSPPRMCGWGYSTAQLAGSTRRSKRWPAASGSIRCCRRWRPRKCWCTAGGAISRRPSTSAAAAWSCTRTCRPFA